MYQIIATWNDNKNINEVRIEPQEYWCDVMKEEKIWDENLTKLEANGLLKEYNLQIRESQEKIK